MKILIFDLSETLFDTQKNVPLILKSELETLIIKGWTLNLFTAADKKYTQNIVNRFYNGVFELIITKDDVLNTKPNSEGLVKILFNYKDLEEIIYIGDSQNDFLAAQSLNIAFATPQLFKLLL